MGTGYDIVADEYDDFYEDYLGRKENAVVRKSLLSGSTRSILDLGCGNGAAARMICDGGGSFGRYVGVDLSKEMLERFHVTMRCGGMKREVRADCHSWSDLGIRFVEQSSLGGRVYFDLVHSEMGAPLSDVVAKNFDLVTALWSLSYLSPGMAGVALTDAARWSVRGARLVATIYTPQFAKSRYVLQKTDEMRTFATENFASWVEAVTPWRVERIRGISGEVTSAMGGRFFGLTSAIDRILSKPHEHTYILLEAKLP